MASSEQNRPPLRLNEKNREEPEKMRKGFVFAAVILFVLSGCGQKELLEEKIGKGVVDKIVVTLAMGNPAYGADCRVITDAEEIEAFLAAFNEAKVGKRVPAGEEWVADYSSYALYCGEELLVEICCNGNDSERVWDGEGFRYVSYGEQPLPFTLYESSAAEEIVVDIDGNEMERPAE